MQICMVLNAEGPHIWVNCPQCTCAENVHAARSPHSYCCFTKRVFGPCGRCDSQSQRSCDLKPRPTSWCHKPLQGLGGTGAKRLKNRMLPCIWLDWKCSLSSIKIYFGKWTFSTPLVYRPQWAIKTHKNHDPKAISILRPHSSHMCIKTDGKMYGVWFNSRPSLAICWVYSMGDCLHCVYP